MCLCFRGLSHRTSVTALSNSRGAIEPRLRTITLWKQQKLNHTTFSSITTPPEIKASAFIWGSFLFLSRNKMQWKLNFSFSFYDYCSIYDLLPVLDWYTVLFVRTSFFVRIYLKFKFFVLNVNEGDRFVQAGKKIGFKRPIFVSRQFCTR